MTDLPTSFVAYINIEGRPIDVVVHLSATELRIWGLHESVPWMKISDFISKGTVTQNTTVDGKRIIINWGSVQLVTYDNPWEGIDHDHAVKIS